VIAHRYHAESALSPAPAGPGPRQLERGPDGQSLRLTAYRRLLYGAAGVGLGLLAATTDVEPTWDRVLLLN
jgi:hypothetical protein